MEIKIGLRSKLDMIRRFAKVAGMFLLIRTI
jgi:hypothetical protein